MARVEIGEAKIEAAQKEPEAPARPRARKQDRARQREGNRRTGRPVEDRRSRLWAY